MERPSREGKVNVKVYYGSHGPHGQLAWSDVTNVGEFFGIVDEDLLSVVQKVSASNPRYMYCVTKDNIASSDTVYFFSGMKLLPELPMPDQVAMANLYLYEKSYRKDFAYAEKEIWSNLDAAMAHGDEILVSKYGSQYESSSGGWEFKSLNKSKMQEHRQWDNCYVDQGDESTGTSVVWIRITELEVKEKS